MGLEGSGVSLTRQQYLLVQERARSRAGWGQAAVPAGTHRGQVSVGLVGVLTGCSDQATSLARACKAGSGVIQAELGYSACWCMQTVSGDQLNRDSQELA